MANWLSSLSNKQKVLLGVGLYLPARRSERAREVATPVPSAPGAGAPA